MIPQAIAERFTRLQKQAPELIAYALIDGVQFTRHTGQSFAPRYGANRALFVGTEDEPLAHAGPWLIDLKKESPHIVATIGELELTYPSVVWLISRLDLESLALVLQLKLDVKLPDGRIALMRFWDPRTLFSLFNALDVPAREEYFSHIDEWHAQVDGKRFHISIHA
jgi:Domain of unknown function (DUF4123)